MQLKIFLMQQKKLIQSLSKIIDKKFCFYIIIISNSLLFTIYFGYRGVFPIDSFLIFNSGYNILNNYHPFKDYWSITGPLLDYLQYIFFFSFDVNWFSYVFHAATINAIFASFIFYFFNKLKLSQNFSFIYAIAVSILAYPSTGTPFMDHHAVIFSLVAVCCFIIGVNKNRNKYWFFCALFIVFSFFSKQIPSAYLVFLISCSILFLKILFKEKNLNDVLFFILGGLFGLSIFLLIFLFNKIPIHSFLLQYIYYPMALGDLRANSLNLDFKNLIAQFKFIYLALFPLIFVFYSILKKNYRNKNLEKDLFILIFVSLSCVVFIYSQLLTRNQVLIFFLVPFYLGISNHYVIKYLKTKHMIYFIAIILCISVVKYHLRFNQDKKFMELSNVNFNLSVDAKILDDKLSNLNWITPRFSKNPSEEIKYLQEVKSILLKDNKSKILITDYQFFPAIIENNNFSPNKWYDDLSVPTKKNKFFSQYKDFYLSKIKSQKIKNIYIIGEDKKIFIEDIFETDCIYSQQLNEILIKLNIEKCNF